ncbi:glycoside hydrolase family 65 protein [Lentilactobacillus senioris]|uniref:glycoside hydrolase family 65 protein n=1 Tax=Lentilactobacillus senioris TaxID=931534 RepID=UPI0022801F0B|nr:glycosyl hydrolase family 65 protein [Lentilactobacillus senioris]MCY9806288.1 glycoside hydrolase family 65 protein [Lentilactobacillus senioris]
MASDLAFQIHLPDLKKQTPDFLETVYSIGNGHLGVRDSNPLQGNSDLYLGSPGLFVNGFYDYYPLSYGEKYSNYPENDQVINRLFDPRYLRIKIGDSDSATIFFDSKILDKNLDMQTGKLTETFEVTTPLQERFHLIVESFASLADDRLYGVQYTILPLNFEGSIMVTKVHPDVNQLSRTSVNDVRVKESEGLLHGWPLADSTNPAMVVTTARSQQTLTAAWRLTQSDETIQVKQLPAETPGYQLITTAQKNTPIQFSFMYGLSSIATNTLEADQNLLTVVAQSEFQAEWQRSAQQWQVFWQHSDIEIDGDPDVQNSLRFNLFQLNQSAGRDGLTNIPAKGLTGNGYGGQYFWDTEIFMLPFFIYTQPQTARKLLQFRAKTLDVALQQARDLGFAAGATFAWRTINGREASSYWPAGLAQFHINADIAYAVDHYVTVTDDQDFLQESGFEIILQTARFWLEYGNYTKIDGVNRFVINTVTGPDEYSDLVNNNYYTNVMVQHNLASAVEYAQQLQRSNPDLLTKLVVTPAEIQSMADAAKLMVLPYDQGIEVKLQFQGFEQLSRLPLADIDKGRFPLLLHSHPLTLYHYQVNKQADTIMADILYPAGNSLAQQTRDYEFYEPITTHDSSLSRTMFAILAARIGRDTAAYDFFTQSVQTDLRDLQGNTANGVHAGNLGGSWMDVVYGFAGLVNNADQFTLNPNLPKQWQRLSFKLQIETSEYQFEIQPQQVTVQLLTGPGMPMVIWDKPVVLNAKQDTQIVQRPAV